VAEEVLLAAHKAKLSLAYVRNPAGFVNEGTKEGEATLGRMQKISGDLAELKKTQTIAEIHIGPKACEGITAILDAFHEVSWAANMLLMQAGRVLPEDKSKQKQVLDKLEAWRLTIYDGPNDDLTKRADEAISQLERVCRPFLK
jgi:hypothetical protein